MCCILRTSVLVLEGSRSTFCGGGSGMQRALALPSKVLSCSLSPHFIPLFLSPTDPDSGSDFKLDAFLASPCETFDPHYGVGGYSGDGDITRPDNQLEFINYVKENTEGKGVHFAMADGVSVKPLSLPSQLSLSASLYCQISSLPPSPLPSPRDSLWRVRRTFKSCY